MRTGKGIFAVGTLVLILVLFFTSWAVKAGETARSVMLRIKGEDGSATQAVKLYSASYALLIGVSHYTMGWPTLPGVIRDLEDVKNELERQGFVVVVLPDPDSVHLKAGIEDFINNYGFDPENRVLIYFAGHGHTEKTSYGAETGYIVPSDAPLPYPNKKSFCAKAISVQTFETYARNIQAKHAFFIFDSCFSGAIFAINRAVPELISYKTTKAVRQFLTAGAADEKVPDESIFKSQFIAGIQGEADSDRNGYVTGTELANFIESRVVRYSNGCQHPQYGTIKDPNLDRGDFVFQCGKAQIEEPAYEPKLPPKTGLDVSGLEEVAKKNKESREKEKSAWETWQVAFQTDIEKVKSLESDPNLPADSRKEAWEKILSAYDKDNPYSKEDEKLRQYVREKIQSFENQIGSEEPVGSNPTFATRWPQEIIIPKPPPPKYTLYIRNHEFKDEIISVNKVICVPIEPLLRAMELKWKQTESNVFIEPMMEKSESVFARPISENTVAVNDSAAISSSARKFAYKGKPFDTNKFWRNGVLFVALNEMTKGLDVQYSFNTKTGIADIYTSKAIDNTGIVYEVSGNSSKKVEITFEENGVTNRIIASLPWSKKIDLSESKHQSCSISAEYENSSYVTNSNRTLTVKILVDGKVWKTATEIEPSRAYCSGYPYGY